MGDPKMAEDPIDTNEPPSEPCIPSPTACRPAKPPAASHSGFLDPEGATVRKWTVESVLKDVAYKPPTNPTSPVPFFHMLERLKTTKREGWRRFGIDRGESVADHMYRMSIMTMLAPPSLSSRINILHCARMALIHDMAESLVGDITPVDNVDKQEKSRRESETMDYLCKTLLGNVGGTSALGLTGRQIKEVWQEYEDDDTLEANFVHDIDKMELLLQMVEYERQVETRVDLGEISWVARRIKLPEVQSWSTEVIEERKRYWASFGKTPVDYSKASENAETDAPNEG